MKSELKVEKWKTVSEKGGREEGISLKGHDRLIIKWPKEDQRDSEGWPKNENETTEGRRKKKSKPEKKKKQDREVADGRKRKEAKKALALRIDLEQ